MTRFEIAVQSLTRTSSIITRFDLPVKYDLNHARAVPLIRN